MYPALWAAWIIGFAILEGLALRDRRKGDTLSEQFWRATLVRDRRPTIATWLARIVVIAFGTWLTGHMAFGWWVL